MVKNRRLLTWLRAAIAVQLVVADDAKCYYPNGQEAPEKPCSSAEGSACCPDKWECLDNGLCHYPPDNLFGRYSCTDQSWKAEGCASNLCTYNMDAAGGESITQCQGHDNQWCCNADATHVNCCKESPEPRPFFALQDGKAYATIGSNQASEAPNLASITGLASGSGDSQPSATPPPSSSPPPSSDSPKSSDGGSSSPASASPTGPTTPQFTLQTQVSSGSAGVSTIIITSVLQPAASSTSTPTNPSPTSSSSNSKVPIIVGCAVGIPLALALIGILAWLLRKRRQQKEKPYSSTPDPYANGNMSPDFAGGAKLHKPQTYKQETDVPELGGQSVGPGRPVSTIQGKAELDSGPGFAQGAVPYAPNLVGVGGGNGVGHTPQSSWGSAPPGYSPGMNQNAWTPAAAPATQGMAEAMDTSVQHPGGGVVGGGGAALQTGGGRYIPYRPPQGHAATASGGGGLQNVPEMAELSTVKTPPA